ncbi:MAG TPA: bifunctional phosphoribosyl-AMP cyclohydrolase/phosphoribosyl-ATP diphosphatase HisIE [Polyangiaceae bacterium]|jgi:phosphoribosyl-ATP pyrophosphohydrolase/phosphoribosyl-AMP cyclohydrolase
MKELKFDEQGLIPAIVQDRLTGEVRMCAFMNREALAQTLSTGRATFFSRSRQALWVKGETSGNVLDVSEVRADCDGDTLLLLVDPAGPSCHTGKQNCFFRPVSADGVAAEGNAAAPFLGRLEAEIEARRQSSGEKSYTKSLLDAGTSKIGDKMREEADEFARALAGESEDRVASEAADVVYHLLVGLASRRVSWRSVVSALAKRSGTSGHAEKAARAPKAG